MSETVFQPEQDGISDDEWQELIARASGEGRRFFSENQLYLAYARNKVIVTRYIARRGVIGLCMIVLGLAAWVYALKADWGLTLVLGIAVTLTGVGMVGTGVVTRRDPASREPIARWLSKWAEARGVQNLVTDATLNDSALDYLPTRVDCLLIVERDPLVDLLLKNDAHSALSALIVSESGYPNALASEARKLLQARADLKVIAVHDATPKGVAMLERLREANVFPLTQRSVLDAGLFPADVTWLAELAPAIPAAHTSRVPLDSLSFDALLVGLRGVSSGELSLYTAIEAARSPELAKVRGQAAPGADADRTAV
ncbi:MAG TPA: hypothetical protein VJV79_34355 [Polyangiaceae bacterium]|nr:hypothetical protein [Polyangiaceae bacterium]